MRLAVISDIHANLEALQSALETIDQKAVDQIVCLGDIVGYGANPSECIALVRERSSIILLGNHDQVAVDLAGAENFNPYARRAAVWTHNHLNDDEKEFLKDLPYTHQLTDVFLVHSSPFEPDEWHYIMNAADAREHYPHFNGGICFIGHSHVPAIFAEGKWDAESPRENVHTLDRQRKHIINVGSVGQPRDGDWRLSFGIFDTESWTYEHLRVEYDVEAAAEKIRLAGLPPMLANRLFVGA